MTGNNYTIPTNESGKNTSPVQMLDFSSIISLILWLLLVLYSSFSSASKGDRLINLNGNKESTELFSDADHDNENNSNRQNVNQVYISD